MNFGAAYGHWQLVILNTFIILVFAFSFFRPRTPRDWRTFGGFSAFVVALFTEMYGFPLTMFPVLAYVYVRLAKREEKEAGAILGEVYLQYARQVPRFLPRWGRSKVVCRPSDPERLSS